MGTIQGFFKYIIFTPLTVVGAISLYIYGGGIVTLFNTISQLFSGHFLEAFLEYFILSALPPTSIDQILTQIITGTLFAGTKWFIAMSARGAPFL